MKLKHLLFGGLALAMASCADDAINNGNGNVNDPTLPLSTATVQIGQWGQDRVTNIGKWSSVETRGLEDWVSKLKFEIPSNAIDVTQSNFDKNGKVYYVPENFEGELDLQWLGFSEGAELYNYGNVTSINNVNFNGLITIYNVGTLDYGISSGGRHTVINTGTLRVSNYANIGEVYNEGTLILEREHNQWWPNEGGTALIPSGMSIFSNSDEDIEMPDGGQFEGKAEIHGTLVSKGNLIIKNEIEKYICGVKVEGDLEIINNLTTSSIEAENISFNGAKIYLTPMAHVLATKDIFMENSGCGFFVNKSEENPEESFALIESNTITGKQVYTDFITTFGTDVFVKANKVSCTKNEGGILEGSVLDVLGENHVWTDQYYGAPACGSTYGKQPDQPEKKGPVLELIASVESPTHNHDIDKEKGRHLSATSIDWYGNTIYVSYHMRGKNWGNDQYDKDEIEGCIETWKFGVGEKLETEIQLGKYMWTNDFDFNHLIIDGSDIVTVGSMENKGAIIAKIQNEFANFELIDEDSNTYSSELRYKVLTTDEKLYGDFENESGNVTEQFIDYKDAGDGNCLIKVGNEYFVATYKGYGRVDAETLKSVKDDNKNPLFVSTDGSVKHIIKNGNEIALLYLNSRPDENKETTKSEATLAIFDIDGTESTFPFNGRTTPLTSFVQPVDGKNVLAYDGANYYACLGKGGLNIGNNIYNYGQNNEPVNGICLDNNYIYLAVGGHLRVLDIKDPKKQIASYHMPNMSANFVKVIDYDNEKYIVVAYGQAGVKVFRLNMNE